MSAAETPSDVQALERLAKSGSDLSKLHRMTFTLRFPAEEAAIQAVAQLEDLAFATTLERDEVEENWVVLASKRMYPVASDLGVLGENLKRIAAAGQGAYEGWQATALE